MKYRQVKVTGLDKGRRGKHYDLIRGVLQQLKMLQPGSAMEIPLTDVGGMGVADLRSAVYRGATAHGLEIETRAVEENFYVWKKVEKE